MFFSVLVYWFVWTAARENLEESSSAVAMCWDISTPSVSYMCSAKQGIRVLQALLLIHYMTLYKLTHFHSILFFLELI